MIGGGRGTWSHIHYKYTAWPVLPHIGKAIIKTINFKRLLLCIHSISVCATPCGYTVCTYIPYFSLWSQFRNSCLLKSIVHQLISRTLSCPNKSKEKRKKQTPINSCTVCFKWLKCGLYWNIAIWGPSFFFIQVNQAITFLMYTNCLKLSTV